MKTPLTHLFGALVLCIIALVGYGVWYAAITSQSAAAADLQERIDRKTESANRIASARAAMAEIAADETAVQNYFVPEAGVVAFINDLETRGRAQGATVSVLSVSKGAANARPTLLFSLSVRGTFDAVMRTFGSIEYAPYDLSVSGLSLGKDATDTWHADFRLLVGSVSASTTPNTL